MTNTQITKVYHQNGKEFNEPPLGSYMVETKVDGGMILMPGHREDERT